MGVVFREALFINDYFPGAIFFIKQTVYFSKTPKVRNFIQQRIIAVPTYMPSLCLTSVLTASHD